MRKDLGKVPAVYPMPVLIVAAYDANGTVQAMNAAWGMISGMDKIHRQHRRQGSYGRGGFLRYRDRQQDAR